MTLLRRFFLVATVALLSACGGGGGDAGTPPFTTPPPAGGGTASDLTITLSSATIPNIGTTPVTVTVTALDVNRNAVSNVAVQVSANANAVVTIGGTAGSVTDASGRLTATVGIGSDNSNRDITITATTGSVTRTAVLKVVSSPAGNVPTSIELIASSTSAGTGGDTVLITAFVKDVNNNALPGATLAFSTSTGTLSNVSTTTSASGAATATFSAGADKTNRTAVITVSTGTISSQLSLPVTGTRLTLSGPSALIRTATADFDVVVTDSRSNPVANVAVTAASSLANPVVATSGTTTNANGQIRFRYTATNAGTDALVFSGAGATVSPNPGLSVSGQNFSFVSPAASTRVPVNTAQVVTVRLEGVAPLAGNVINFAATGGVLSASSAATDATGQASVSITSASAGPVTVQATVANTATSTTLPLMIVATQASQLVLQVTPTAIAPNIGTSVTNQAQVVAKVTDASGNPVAGKTVNFTRVTDPSGGNLLQASATTDTSGLATVTYRSGSESTASNGVVLRATVADAPTVAGTAALTVNQTALFIALGTGNVIANLDPQTYRKDWVVYVTDANGIPVNGVTLTIKAIPTYYRTGKLVFSQTVWAYDTPISQCRNEDANANGILDAGEDDNGDGVLWPGNVIGVAPSTVQTQDGRATISLTYAESYAPWIQLRLTASATVAGTESRTDAEFIVSGSGDDFSNPTVPPAGVNSPFGLVPKAGAVCSLVQ